jgi:hypothetical protein
MRDAGCATWPDRHDPTEPFGPMLALLIAVTMSSGCATYRRAVTDDFRDAFKANFGVGFGLYADAKVTSFVDAGLGWGGYWANLGLENRYTDFLHPSLDGCPFPIGAIPGALPDEDPLRMLRMPHVHLVPRSDFEGDYTVAGMLFDAEALTKWDAYGVKKCSPHTVFKHDEPQYTTQPLGFEAGLGLLLINARIGFDPVEFLDLLATVCGWDLLRDASPVAPSASRAK